MGSPKTAPATPSVWQTGLAVLRFDEPDLPHQAEVVIVGGGLAGLACARLLAEAGVHVVVLEAADTLGGKGHSGRCSGLVLNGFVDHPVSLIGSVGLQRARDLYRFTHENCDALDGLGVFDRCGSLAVAMDDNEIAGVDANLAALRELGISAERTQSALSPGVRLHPTDGMIEPPAVLLRLAEAARSAGATLATGQRMVALHSETDGVQVKTENHVIKAHMVVLCAGPALQQCDPFFADKLYPVRTQFVAGSIATPPHTGATGQHGYLTWRPLSANRMMVSGCRWATPHLETGETDDAVISTAVDEKLSAISTGRLGLEKITHRWTTIAAHTCDGLPIIGPLPGRVSLVSCAGWNGRPWSLALRAAQAVSDGILDRRTKGQVPPLMSAHRFL